MNEGNEGAGGGENVSAADGLAGAAAAAAAAKAAEGSGADQKKAAAPASDAGAKTAGGEGARPEWLDENFWDPEKKQPRIEEMAKSVKDLRTKVSAGLKEKPPEKPEGYEFKPIDGVKIDPNDRGLTLARQIAHKAGLGNEAFNAFVNNFLKDAPEIVKGWSQKTSEQIEKETAEANTKELAKLHSDPKEAQNIVDSVVQFFASKVEQGVIDKKDYAALMRMGGDAAGIRALAKIQSIIWNEPPIPLDAQDTDGYSIQQYYKDAEDPRYQTDPAFRRQAKEKLERIVGNKPATSSIRGAGQIEAKPFVPRTKPGGVDKKQSA